MYMYVTSRIKNKAAPTICIHIYLLYVYTYIYTQLSMCSTHDGSGHLVTNTSVANLESDSAYSRCFG